MEHSPASAVLGGSAVLKYGWGDSVSKGGTMDGSLRRRGSVACAAATLALVVAACGGGNNSGHDGRGRRDHDGRRKGRPQGRDDHDRLREQRGRGIFVA